MHERIDLYATAFTAWMNDFTAHPEEFSDFPSDPDEYGRACAVYFSDLLDKIAGYAADNGPEGASA